MLARVTGVVALGIVGVEAQYIPATVSKPNPKLSQATSVFPPESRLSIEYDMLQVPKDSKRLSVGIPVPSSPQACPALNTVASTVAPAYSEFLSFVNISLSIMVYIWPKFSVRFAVNTVFLGKVTFFLRAKKSAKGKSVPMVLTADNHRVSDHSDWMKPAA